MINQDTHLEEIFKEAPLIAFKRQSNIRESLIKTKIAPKRDTKEKRVLNGMKKCGKCTV